MTHFKSVSDVGVECQVCGELLPKNDIEKHTCNAHSALRKATAQYELPEVKQEAKMETIEKKIVMSESINELAAALSKSQALMEPATKDQSNPFFKSTYADLASVWKACRGPLSANGLAVSQLTSADGPKVTVTTMLIHASGQFISSELTMQADKVTPQGIGSAITYARRYALSAIVGISAEDDDGNAASGHKVEAVKGLPADLKDKFIKAQKLLGDEKFFEILGGAGYEKVDEIIMISDAKQILETMGEAYKAKKEAK